MHKAPSQSDVTELSRLRWQCRRGMLELDIFLQSFMDKAYDNLSPKQRHTFSLLLETPDQMLLDYLVGRVIPYDKEIADVANQIRLTAGPAC
ncbi:succinate dehydrogenase assembly factor 2 [Beggiatoa alba]|nr:succinate dehydrogenase assembly factor 2 [Beggiatoa alba]